MFVMLDLDIGMNSHLVQPFSWDDSRRYDRGKVLTATELDAGLEFGRYLDVDGDGVPFRTLARRASQQGRLFHKGDQPRQVRALHGRGQPLRREHGAAAAQMGDRQDAWFPPPKSAKAPKPADVGVVYYGSTGAAMDEALAMLADEGLDFDAMRLRAYPFGREVAEFLAHHRRILIVEQNRDAQMRTLLLIDFPREAAKFAAILNYDGSPITARFIARDIRAKEGVARRVQEAAE